MSFDKERFAKLLKEDVKNLGGRRLNLAMKLSVPEKTLEDWMRGKSGPSKKYRARLEGIYPEMDFGKAAASKPTVPSLGDIKDQLQLGPEIPSNEIDPIELKMYCLFAQEAIFNTSKILKWFLFETNSPSRDEFRRWLGKNWEEFAVLVRCMIGETSFMIALKEGAVKIPEDKR